MSPPNVIVGEGTNIRVGADLELGAGNFWQEGKLGLTAGLFALIRDGSGGVRNEPLRVRKGAEITAGSHRFRVEAVKRSPGGKGVITLRPL